ncbi:CPBP family intramembrane glutamic endopeptidase [Aestuariimicrobium ganziense]|uniref:CPBP family intramembrane glutamic endopeptidase n=1 Tax=Aestuariimicrobium ganziense TaxID=2773677 RepID=UPI0019432F70|nr:type II CAAX endopeptidase family protein [Aestuariimicrobium ganziense]
MWWQAPALRDDGLGRDQPMPGPRPWWARRWAVLAAFVVTTMVVAGLIMTVGAMMQADPWTYLGLGQLLGTIAGYLVVLWLEGRLRNPLELAPRRWVGLPAGLLLGAVLVSVAVSLITLLGFREFTGTDTPARFWQQVFTLGVVAGISEEILFRGIFHRFIERWLGTWGATAAAGLLFGLAHLGNPQATLWGAIAIAIEAGLLFGVLYSLTRSLWVVIGLHAGWNLVQGLVHGSVVSGSSGRGHGFLVSNPKGPALLSGGNFGIEASLVTVVLLLLVTLWLARRLSERGLVVAPSWRRRSAPAVGLGHDPALHSARQPDRPDLGA